MTAEEYPQTVLSSEGEIIETDLNCSAAEVADAIATVKFLANRIPVGDAPDPEYAPIEYGSFTIEESIYFIEATLNFDAEDDVFWTPEYSTDRLYFSLQHTSGNVNLEDVVDAYDELFADIETNTPSGYVVLVCNVWGVEIGKNEIECVVDIIYVPEPEGEYSVDPLSSEDNWKAFGGQGKCSSGGIGDATTRLTQLINWYGIAAWNGSSGASTGGQFYVCPNGWPKTYTNVQGVPANNGWHSTSSFNSWPVRSCNYSLRMNQTAMESSLASFFTWANNNMPSGYTMQGGNFTWDEVIHGIGTPCYQTGWSHPEYYHKVRLSIAQIVCQPLPW